MPTQKVKTSYLKYLLFNISKLSLVYRFDNRKIKL